MSLLAQTRLAALSQRCLAKSAWRNEALDGYGYIQNHTLQSPSSELSNLRSASCELLAERNNSLNYHHQIQKSKVYSTPKLCQRRNPFLDRMLIKEFRSNVDSVLPIHKNAPHMYRTIFADPISLAKFDNDTTKNFTSKPCEKTKYLLESRQFRYTSIRHNPSVCFTSNYYNVPKPLPKFHSDYNYDNGKKQSTKHNRKRLLVSMIGVLSLFKTTSDIEDEKVKLADEQEVKKMKPAELLIAKGVLSMWDQDYAEADSLFHKALHISQEEENEQQENLILNLLASNFFESGDLENAEKLFIELIKRMIAQDVEPTDPAILELSLKLASIYSKNACTHQKATKGFKFVISTLLNSLGDLLFDVEDIEIRGLSEERLNNLALLGWGYDWFAKHLIALNDYTSAAEMSQKALEISSKVLGPLHDQTLILLNDVGTTMAMNNSPEEGKTFIKQAVEGAIESQSRELASFYVNLGLVNLKLKQFSEAKRYCEYSIEIALKNREHHSSQEVLKLSRTCLSEVERLLGVES